MGCPVGSGSPSCTSNANQSLQCTSNFNCDSSDKVCVQYTLRPSGGQQSGCITNCTAGSSFDKKAACTAANGDHIWASSSLCTGGNLAELCGVGVCNTINTSRCQAVPSNTGQVCAGKIGDNFSEIFIKGPTSRTTRPTLDVTCQWDVTDFDTVESVKAYLAEFGESQTCTAPPCPQGGVSNVYNQVIMPYFCSLPDTNTTGNIVCPLNNVTGTWVGNECSRMISTSEAGDMCRAWINNITNIGDPIAINAANSVTYTGYCNNLSQKSQRDPSLQGGEANECVCINRGRGGSTGVWDQITEAAVKADANINSLGPVGCWYTPCNAGPSQIVFRNPGPNTTIQSVYYPTSCPSVCKIITNIQGNIENSTIKNSINCKGGGGSTGGTGGTGGGGGGTGGGGTGGGGTGGGGTTTTTESFWSKYKWWIIGVVVAILLLIIIIVAVTATQGNDDNKKEEIDPLLLAASM